MSGTNPQAAAAGEPGFDAWQAAKLMLVAGSLCVAISLGVRHGFGLFLQPISMENGWGRETFAFAMAVQNLAWGAAQPFAGALSDRFGAGKVILGGAVLYVAGLALMAIPQDGATFALSAGLLIGLGLSGTTFPVVFGAVSRAVPAEKRSLAMGITMSVGSFGQFAALPLTLGLITGFGWAAALLCLSALTAIVLPLSYFLNEKPPAKRGAAAAVTGPNAPGLGALGALKEAGSARDFWLLSLGFFVCGFQVVFIGIHLPAYLADEGIGAGVATVTLALVGLVNIAGTYYAGKLGGTRSKPMILVWIYLGRALVIVAFVTFPLSAWSAYAFGAAMGIFWLSTVPPTNGIVASRFGVKNMAMLGGIVFFAHQVGSFMGVWLGGYLYDHTGSYDAVWWIAVALSVVAAALNYPICETKAAALPHPIPAPAK